LVPSVAAAKTSGASPLDAAHVAERGKFVSFKSTCSNERPDELAQAAAELRHALRELGEEKLQHRHTRLYAATSPVVAAALGCALWFRADGTSTWWEWLIHLPVFAFMLGYLGILLSALLLEAPSRG
jgi:hypothetical protein